MKSRASSQSRVRCAIFDLDYTLLPYDTLFLFANFVLRKHRLRLLYLAVFGSLLPLFALRLISVDTIKRAFLSFLAGLPIERVDSYAHEFAEQIQGLFYPDLIDCISRHRERGDLLVLNTASPDLYVDALKDRLGFDLCIATPFQRDARLPLLPRTTGPNNKGETKMVRLRARIEADHPGADLEVVSAYSDSRADLPILYAGKDNAVVHPDEKLVALARENNWQIWTPARPAGGQRLALLRQACGLFKI